MKELALTVITASCRNFRFRSATENSAYNRIIGRTYILIKQRKAFL